MDNVLLQPQNPASFPFKYVASVLSLDLQANGAAGQPASQAASKATAKHFQDAQAHKFIVLKHPTNDSE